MLGACGGGDINELLNPPERTGTSNRRPTWLTEPQRIDYDGTADDLLTGGLGRTGLAGGAAATMAAIVAESSPDAAELRRLAIYAGYRASVDVKESGGFGTLFGPGAAADGRIAGTEYGAFADDGTGAENVSIVVQIPSTFDVAAPCLIATAAPASHGVYGSIATAGEWALKRGCAVAHTDKGAGNGVHDLQADSVGRRDGTRAAAATVGRSSQFTAPIEAARRATFNAATPNRFAIKHAHSTRNPQADWGRDLLRAAEAGLYALNLRYGDPDPANAGGTLKRFIASNTLVIAAATAEGAGAALAAAESDDDALIDGVVGASPSATLPATLPVVIRRGGRTAALSGRPLLDTATFANLYQPCAALADPLSPGLSEIDTAAAGARCASLAARGLLAAAGTSAQAREARDRMLDYGWETETSILAAAFHRRETTGVAVTLANSLGGFPVEQALCGLSFAYTDAISGRVVPAPNALRSIHGTGNGRPPMRREDGSGSIEIVNDRHPGAPIREGALSASASTGALDYNLDGAQCLRALVTASDASATQVASGLDATRLTGRLRGKPAIIVHGRADPLAPANHGARAYFALSRAVDVNSRLSYVEVRDAQHLDAFNGEIAGFDARYVPLVVYFHRALDAVYENLRSGTALPASQLVRTVPRGGTDGAAPALTAANVPAIQPTPARGDTITFAPGINTLPGVLDVPD